MTAIIIGLSYPVTHQQAAQMKASARELLGEHVRIMFIPNCTGLAVIGDEDECDPS